MEHGEGKRQAARSGVIRPARDVAVHRIGEVVAISLTFQNEYDAMALRDYLLKCSGSEAPMVLEITNYVCREGIDRDSSPIPDTPSRWRRIYDWLDGFLDCLH